METAIYLRKSRAEEQSSSQGETLRNHRRILLDYAQRQGLCIAEIYEEVVSGESLYARPQMLRLLEAVENGAYGAVLCMDIDRLGRGGMRDQGIILDAFKYSGTKIITPDKTYDLNNELDEELTEFKTFFSRRELKIINKRLQRGLRRTAEDGGYLANAPYGYQRAVTEKKPTLKIVEEEAFFVRLMFEWYISGRGTSAIAAELNRLGAHPRRAGQFSRGAVGLILQNPVYSGKIVWNRTKRLHGIGGVKTAPTPPEEWIVAEGLHPPIIPFSLFEAAQRVRAARAIPCAKLGRTLKNPLAGVVRCGGCGKPMQRLQSKGREYLLCVTAGCCAATPLALVENALRLAAAPLLSALLLPAPPPPAGGEDFSHAALLTVQREQERVKKQRASLHGLLEEGIYDSHTFQERLQALEQKRQALCLQEQLCRQRLSRPALPGDPDPKTAAQLLAAASPAQRNRIYRALFGEVWYRRSHGEPAFTLTTRFLSRDAAP